jgi:hypothetical protein
MIIAFGFLVFALLILAVWNFVDFHRLKSATGSNKIEEPRYWELKYRMDYLVAVAAMGLAVLAFYGYQSFQSAKQAVKLEIDAELGRIREDVNNTEKVVQSLNSFSDSIRDDVSTSGARMNDQINHQVATLSQLEQKIRKINSRNIVQQEFYVVRSLKLSTNHETKPGSNKVYYKDLITDKEEKLPVFSNPPLVIPISQSNTTINLFNIRADSFEAYLGGVSISGDIPEVIEYSVVIIGEIKAFDSSFDNSFK